MYVSNTKVQAIPYSVIMYVMIFALILAFSVKMVADMMQKMNYGMPAKSSMPVLQQIQNASPSVVELFTSEGCSSCPSADKLVALAQKEFNDNTIVLSYHVDYWDKLGWKDPYSRSVFTDRQRAYAQHLNLESIYTPQVIVNGKTEFVGSNKSALWNAISSYKEENNNRLELQLLEVRNNQLPVTYNYEGIQKNEVVVIELVLKNATTNVKRGENGGATLMHINIVQDMVEKSTANATVTLNLPADFVKENYMVVAFVQNNKSFEITIAKKIPFI